jgi:hypothetical protein
LLLLLLLLLLRRRRRRRRRRRFTGRFARGVSEFKTSAHFE